MERALNPVLALSFLFFAWIASEAIFRPQTLYAAGETSHVVGLYETDRANCGNRLAMDGDSLYVGSRGFQMLRGKQWAGEEFAFDDDGVRIGDRYFWRCAQFRKF